MKRPRRRWSCGRLAHTLGSGGGMTICPRARSPPGGFRASKQATKLVFGLLSGGGPIQFHVKLNEALGTPIP